MYTKADAYVLDEYKEESEEVHASPKSILIKETYSREETSKLILESTKPLEDKEHKKEKAFYSTYSLEECFTVMNQSYDPRNFPQTKKHRKKKQLSAIRDND